VRHDGGLLGCVPDLVNVKLIPIALARTIRRTPGLATPPLISGAQVGEGALLGIG